MGSIFERITRGTVHQTAYVTNDLDQAIDHWAGLLGGPRLEKDHIDGITGFELRGRPATSVHDQAIGYLGGMQIELIQPISGENVYFEALEGVPPGTIVPHHLGFDCVDLADYRQAKADFAAMGYPVVQGGYFGETEFSYFDLRDRLGTFVELLWLDPATREAFDQLRAVYDEATAGESADRTRGLSR